jgi:hypothetical protein
VRRRWSGTRLLRCLKNGDGVWSPIAGRGRWLGHLKQYRLVGGSHIGIGDILMEQDAEMQYYFLSVQPHAKFVQATVMIKHFLSHLLPHMRSASLICFLFTLLYQNHRCRCHVGDVELFVKCGCLRTLCHSCSLYILGAVGT